MVLGNLGAFALLLVMLLFGSGAAFAQNTTTNIFATKHNLSASSGNTTRAAAPGSGGTDQICVFCHTPHAANSAAPGPLWNRSLTDSATYTQYTSNSLDAAAILGGEIGKPGGASKLCLSCHDGTLALGAVGNSPGSGMGTGIAMVGTGTGGTMPAGEGVTTGATRNLGTDLRNDHPISFTFNGTLASRDGELRTPPYSAGGRVVVGPRTGGSNPLLPLDHQNHVQCTTCHDPHLAGDSIKFLRLNRFQKNAAPGVAFNPANDQICLGCHDKLGNSWAQSAHANPSVASYTYKSAAATQREFPTTTQVWEAACLNCHDTHAVQGTRRLLREGTDGAGSPKAGGTAAQEQTCYQCHTTTTASIVTTGTMTATTGVPDIQTEFGRARTMPITSANQRVTAEAHDIGGNFNDPTFVDCSGATNGCGADFIESRARLGANNHANRHVECTDCHNPHRVIKNSLFNGQGSATQRTHTPAAGTNGVDGNVASGALRGAWGVEPVYPVLSTSSVWPEMPSSYVVKRGDPGSNTSTAKTSTYLTREYQLCFKCHSDYGAGTDMPTLGNTAGGTPSGTNQMTRYTNIAAEFAVKATDTPTSGGDQGEKTRSGTACNGADCNPTGTSPDGATATNNHRSWHPVMFPTGRDRAERNMASTGNINVLDPFRAGIGRQTMQCSDCHGETNAWGTTGAGATGADRTKVQGPHGSASEFLLKGSWDLNVRLPSPASTSICGKCHDNSYSSGFNTNHRPDDKMGGEACMYCHIAVPHGWKNKAFLVNLRCAGPEAGAAGSCVNIGGSNYSSVTRAPYYISSRLRISSWAVSGSWQSASCGGSTMEDGCPRTGN